LVASLLACVAIVGCSEAAAPVVEKPIAELSPADFNGRWPLTVASVRVFCVGRSAVVVESPAGKRYGLNGKARTAGRQEAWADIEEIWAPDGRGGRSAEMGTFSSRAIDACRPIFEGRV
jgi:hypothetical protein